MSDEKYFVLPDLEAKRKAQAKRRADAVANELCVRCCKRPHEPNTTRCAPCGGKARDKRRDWVRQVDRFNTCCQAHGFHRADCRRAA